MFKDLLFSAGTIESIEEVSNYTVPAPITPQMGENGAQAGFSQNLAALMGHSTMEGFKVKT